MSDEQPTAAAPVGASDAPFRTGLTAKQRRVVYLALLVFVIFGFAAGLLSGYSGRHSTICKDGRPPLQQRDSGMGQVEYLCHNGRIVTNSE